MIFIANNLEIGKSFGFIFVDKGEDLKFRYLGSVQSIKVFKFHSKPSVVDERTLMKLH